MTEGDRLAQGSVVRVRFREFGHDYGSYQFGYSVWAEMEAMEERPRLFEQGFLPFSANLKEPRALFYLARSLRVDLGALRLDKKRRYLQRQLTDRGATMAVEPKAAFTGDRHAALREAASAWQEERFGSLYMSPERLDYLWGLPHLTHVATCAVEGTVFAYALLDVWEGGSHYWFVFYDPHRYPELSPGKWILGAYLDWAGAAGHSHAYLGTTYGERSAYKRQGLSGWEFFDGEGWSSDDERLRALHRQDDDAKAT